MAITTRDAIEMLTGKRAVSSVTDLDAQIEETRAKLLQLYKLKTGAFADKPPEEVTDEWLDYLAKRYNAKITVEDNVLSWTFDTHMSFRYKERDVPFYVTAKTYAYDLRLDLITYTSAVYTMNTLFDKNVERHGIYAYEPDSLGLWGHPHAADHIRGSNLLESLCYGDNYFPHDVHKCMRLNEIINYLDKALAWIRGITADDNYGKVIQYTTQCKNLRDVLPNNYPNLDSVQKALITLEGMPRNNKNVSEYAHYYACYAYQKIARSQRETKDNILHAIGTDVAFGIGEYYPEDWRDNLADPWYVETLYNCRKELEEMF